MRNVPLVFVSRSIDDRYKAMSDVAKTRSVIALGVSCFKLQPTVLSGGTDGSTANGKPCGGSRRAPVNFVVQTFNIFVLCAENYVVEPVSLRFLIQHGFDFNLQYSKGLPYTGGNDKVNIVYLVTVVNLCFINIVCEIKFMGLQRMINF